MGMVLFYGIVQYAPSFPCKYIILYPTWKSPVGVPGVMLEIKATIDARKSEVRGSEVKEVSHDRGYLGRSAQNED